MKHSITAFFIIAVLLSCKKSADDSPKFPECVGIKESLNSQNINTVSRYSGRIWGGDTVIYTQFIFTDYVDYNYLLSAERSFNMSIKFSKGSTTIYQGTYCYYNYMDKKWYAQSGFDYRGQYSSWNFSFETFDCSKISGACNVVLTDISEPIIYNFEGNR